MTIPVTFETTDAMLVVPISVTQLTTVVATSTVVVSPPVCTTAYNFVVASGTYAGQVIQEDTVTDNGAGYYYAILGITPASNSAIRFTQKSSGQFISNDGRYWTTYASDGSTVYDLDDNTANDYGLVPIFCTIDTTSTGGVTDAVGLISCTQSGLPVSLYNCGDSSLTYASPSYTACGSPLTVAAIYVC
jgi:hypothetical protein